MLQCHAIGLVSVSVCCSTCAQVRAYQGHMRELEACNDPVVRATAAFMRLMADVVSFDDSTKRGDAYMMEIVHARWLHFSRSATNPGTLLSDSIVVLVCCDQSYCLYVHFYCRYVECANRTIETLYHQMDPPELQEQRCNRCARVRAGGCHHTMTLS